MQPIFYYQRNKTDIPYEVQVMGLGINSSGYPGAFTPIVKSLLSQAIGNSSSVLNLFSGISLLGHERVDVSRSEATLRQNVFDFVRQDKRFWDFVVLDPPYEIKRKSKLKSYGISISVSSDVKLRRCLASYLREHAKNILWLDICAPLPAGFFRKKLYLLLPGGYHTVRILSWLQNRNNGGLFADASS